MVLDCCYDLRDKTKVKIIILCGIPHPQSIDHIPVVLSIIYCVSFFVSSCFSSPKPKIYCELS